MPLIIGDRDECLVLLRQEPVRAQSYGLGWAKLIRAHHALEPLGSSMISSTTTRKGRKHSRYGRVPVACFLILFLSVPLGEASETASPALFVIEDTVEAVVAVLRTKGLSTQQRRAQIENIAYKRFDFESMSRTVLGRSWERLSPAQQEEFTKEFRDCLARYYGKRLELYDNQSVEVLGELREPKNYVTVHTKIVGTKIAPIDYRLKKRDANWRIVNVTVEGFSLISSYRDQFRGLLSRGGPEYLLNRLREKNAEGDARAGS